MRRGPARRLSAGARVMNAKLVVSLMRDMPKLVLWAHHSHLHYNSLGWLTPRWDSI
jgi:hypothetical protein